MRLILLLIFSLLFAPFTFADSSGIIKAKSPFSVTETANRFEAAIKAKGMKVFPRFDHSAAAKEYGKAMPATVVISFGNPKYGTPLMVKNLLAGIDFPPKAIIYEDQENRVWLAYNSADYLYNTIFKRHGLEFKQEDVEFYRNVLVELTKSYHAETIISQLYGLSVTFIKH